MTHHIQQWGNRSLEQLLSQLHLCVCTEDGELVSYASEHDERTLRGVYFDPRVQGPGLIPMRATDFARRGIMQAYFEVSSPYCSSGSMPFLLVNLHVPEALVRDPNGWWEASEPEQASRWLAAAALHGLVAPGLLWSLADANLVIPACAATLLTDALVQRLREEQGFVFCVNWGIAPN